MQNESTSERLEIIQQDSSLGEIIRAEIDGAVATAKAYPRSLKIFMDRAMSMATINEDVADSCSYALPRAGKELAGPSVRLAEIVCSSYGNVRAASRVISIDAETITAQGICHDLETNYSATVEVKRSIMQNEYKWDPSQGKSVKTGKMVRMNNDMIVVTGNAACSIAYRNAVFKVIPSALISGIYDEAKKVAMGTEATLPVKRQKALDYLHSLKVTDKQICEVLDLKKVEDIDLEKLALLRGMVTLIKNGESTVKDLFSPQGNGPSLEDIDMLYEMKKENLTAEEQENAERIIKNKEEKSYGKLLKLLQTK